MAEEDRAPGEWLNVVRRIRFNGVVPGVAGRIVKAVALDLATYADFETGGRVRPGIARIAVDCEIDYRTARSCFAAIRNLGLLRLVRGARRRGHSDEYQLVLPADLLDRVGVLTPADMDCAIERIRDRNRHKDARPAPDDDPGTGSADTRTDPPVQASATPVPPVDNPPVRVSAEPVQPAATGSRTGVAGTPGDGRTGVAVSPYGCRSAPPPRQSTETSSLTEPDIADLRADLTVVADPPPLQDQIFSDGETGAAAPGPCAEHPSQRAGPRDDGRPACVFCRGLANNRTTRPSLRVIPGGAA